MRDGIFFTYFVYAWMILFLLFFSFLMDWYWLNILRIYVFHPRIDWYTPKFHSYWASYFFNYLGLHLPHIYLVSAILYALFLNPHISFILNLESLLLRRETLLLPANPLTLTVAQWNRQATSWNEMCVTSNVSQQ